MGSKAMHIKTKNYLPLIMIVSTLSSCNSMAPILETVQSIQSGMPNSGSALSSQNVAAAIKQALGQGVGSAVNLLGSKGGFDPSALYRIPLPEQFNKPASLLRKFGMGSKVDEFETRLNSAAKLAVKQATPVFTQAVKDMSVGDAINIMKGTDNAATTYFRGKTEASLRNKFSPIISKATNETGLTSYYKSLSSTVNTLSPSLKNATPDIDKYVLDNAMNALFSRVAVEEQQIRKDPVKRTTDLMKSVYGYFDKK